MFYSILLRILRRHAFFHLVVPLLVGILVEALYAFLRRERLPDYLLSSHRFTLYAGIFIAYFVVIAILLKKETSIGLRRLELDALAAKLHGAKSLFAVAPTPFEEWFDPAAQVYLAAIYGERLTPDPFRYERVILLPFKSAKRNLDSDYLDRYHATCLVEIHRRLNIDLYVMQWKHINRVLRQMAFDDLVLIGYYPRILAWVPGMLQKAVRWVIWPIRRHRVHQIAGGVIEDQDGARSAFLFSKHENVVDVDVEPESTDAYVRFVDGIKAQIYQPRTTLVKPIHDFKRAF